MRMWNFRIENARDSWPADDRRSRSKSAPMRHTAGLAGRLAFCTLFNSFWPTLPIRHSAGDAAVTTATLMRPFELCCSTAPGWPAARTPRRLPSTSRVRTLFSYSQSGGRRHHGGPRPLAPISAYGHVAAFVREAPEAQRQALWQSVAEQCNSASAPSPSGSHCGAGVPGFMCASTTDPNITATLLIGRFNIGF